MDASDCAKLGEWFSLYGRGLVLYATQWLGRDAAEDVVQEVFLRLWTSLAGQVPGSPAAVMDIKHWLFRSVRNAAIDRLRRQKRRHLYEERRAKSRPAWFESQSDDELDARAVEEALGELPHDQREIIVLRIWAGMTLAEAAKVTGEPVSTLFSRYRAGLASLRKRMETSCEKANSK